MNKNFVNFLDFFPSARGETPRPQQIKALDAIFKAFAAGKKYVIARLPTGSGKSHIATAIARSSRPLDDDLKLLLENYEAFRKDKNGQWVHEEIFNERPYSSSYILTITRSLQNQYLELFPGQLSAKGKNNYQCEVDNNVTVDFAPCLFTSNLKNECFKLNRCPYFKAQKDAIISLDPVLNYRVYFNLPRFLQKRQYIICDEARELEREIVGQYSLTINYSQLQQEDISFKKILSDDSEEAFLWLQDIFVQIKKQIADLKQKLNLMSEKYSTSEGLRFKTSQRFGKLSNLYNSLWDIIDNWHECEFLVESKDSKTVTLVPFNIKPIAQRFFENAERVLLTSATISDPEEYAKSLGIKKDEYSVVDVESSFDPNKSPIICSTKYNLSYKTMESNLPKVLEMVSKICEEHKNEKGIIHTHTLQITEAVRKKLGKNKRFLFREEGITNEDIIKQHYSSKEPTILVSPSLDTGISLDDEWGRFQIIVKAPYLPLSSKRVKKIFDKNPRYYNMLMIDTLIQMSGRCTRSKDDHSITYLLDGTAVRAITSNKNYLPKYFIERFL